MSMGLNFYSCNHNCSQHVINLSYAAEESSLFECTCVYVRFFPARVYLTRNIFEKIIVDGYRAVGSLNTKMIASQPSNFCCCCCTLLISVNGETCKSAIKRPIKIRTHHVVRKHLTATVTDKKIVNK